MGKKHVQKYVNGIHKHHQRHRKAVYRIFKKMAKHPGCYKQKGGMMLMGAAGMRVRPKKVGRKGALRRNRVLRKKRKLPAWVTKPVPKTGWPSTPPGMNKRAAGWYARHKKKAKALWKKGKEKVKKVYDHGKKIVADTADRVADRAMEKASDLMDQAGDAVDNHIDEMGSSAEKYMDENIDKYSGKASKYISKKSKKGSGSFADRAKKGGMMLTGFA